MDLNLSLLLVSLPPLIRLEGDRYPVSDGDVLWLGENDTAPSLRVSLRTADGPVAAASRPLALGIRWGMRLDAGSRRVTAGGRGREGDGGFGTGVREWEGWMSSKLPPTPGRETDPPPLPMMMT